LDDDRRLGRGAVGEKLNAFWSGACGFPSLLPQFLREPLDPVPGRIPLLCDPGRLGLGVQELVLRTLQLGLQAGVLFGLLLIFGDPRRIGLRLPRRLGLAVDLLPELATSFCWSRISPDRSRCLCWSDGEPGLVVATLSPRSKTIRIMIPETDIMMS